MVIRRDESTEGITAIATFGGRLFYAGAGSKIISGDQRSPQLTGFVFFTQIMDSIDKLNLCHQEADPTSEHVSDLIDTDGGFVVIKESGLIFRLLPIQVGLLVFAENGVWMIRGGDTIFTPLAFSVEKITGVGAISDRAIISVEDTIFYWALGGIYVIGIDPDTGVLSARNMTENTIQTLYNAIRNEAKRVAIGVFDSAARQIRWQYNSSPTFDGVTGKFDNDKELVFDLVLNAFYPVDMSNLTTDSPKISGYLIVPDLISTDVVLDIVAGADEVVVGADDVVATTEGPKSPDTRVKYLLTQKVTGGNLTYTFGFYRNAEFLDWVSADGVGIDAPGFLLTGYEIEGDVMRDKQAPYIVMHFERTENGFEFDANGDIILSNQSSALVQGRWEWTSSPASGRFTATFEAYRLRRHFTPTDVSDPFDYGFDVISTKNKFRGMGKALNFRLDTSPGKDCRPLGWGFSITGGIDV